MQSNHHQLFVSAVYSQELEGMSTKCNDDENNEFIKKKRATLVLICIFVIFKYSFWNHFYEKFKSRK